MEEIKIINYWGNKMDMSEKIEMMLHDDLDVDATLDSMMPNFE